MIAYPKVKFSDVGGNDSFKWHFKERYNSVDFTELCQEMNNDGTTSFLIYGPKGCGKSLLAHSVAGEYQLPLLSLTATELNGENPEANVLDLFRRATELAPCILLIENIETRTSGRNTDIVVGHEIFVKLAVCVHGLWSKNLPVLVICTIERLDLLDTAMRFNVLHAVRIPNKCARESILRVLCKKPRLAGDVSLSDIAGRTRGYMASDLKSLISLTITYAMHRVMSDHELQRESRMVDCGSTGEGNRMQKDTLHEEMDRLKLTNVDILKALAEVKPSLCREDGLVFSNTTWDDLGGMNSIRKELKLNLMDELRRPEHYMNMGIRVLLYGPPGCGKTSIAKAIANDFDMNLLYVGGEELLSEVVAQTEKNIFDLFTRARSLVPCLIFFDDIDSLCYKRSPERNEVNYVAIQLLLECFLLKPGSEMYVLAATNNLDKLCGELFPRCRVNKCIYVGLPSPEERVEILRVLTKSGTSPKLADDVDLDRIGKDRRCDSISGERLNMLVQKAREACLMETNFESPEAHAPCEIPLVNKSHFDKAFESMY